jgi:diguanylate cyclase (GGDEF)-like protein
MPEPSRPAQILPHSRHQSGEVQTQRLVLRLKILRQVGVFYALNAALAVFASAIGIVPASAAISISGAGAAHYLLFYFLFKRGVVGPQGDSFLAVPQTLMASAIVLGVIEFWPQLTVLMLSLLPLIFCFGALAFRWSTALKLWGLVSATTGVLLFRHRDHFEFPHGNPQELLFSSLFYSELLLCYLGVGLFGSQLRMQLYRRNKALAEATSKIEAMASSDELTGALSRRAISSQLDLEMQRAIRNQTAIAVVLLDLDNFKQINDQYGHGCGDEVLRGFVATVSATTRSVDLLGRYGGEEFLMVLTDASENAVLLLVERIREAVVTRDWSPIAAGLRVTVSAGVAIFHGDETMTNLIKRADKALYAAKHAGRNQVKLAAKPA